jgi:hypothetical protein
VSGPFRVLVTGSRDWDAPRTVHAALDAVAAEQAGRPVVVVHGGCRTGADAAAAVWARRADRNGWHVTEEPHPADWNTHGRSAGPIRNRRMVEAGADLVLAFVGPGPSRGTRGTIALAVGAGLPVRRYEAPAVGR